MPKMYQAPVRYKPTELRTYYAPYFVTRSLNPSIGTAVPTLTRSGTATYLDNTGSFQQAASGVPRFEYEWNPITSAYECAGLLIEANGQTNLRTWSNDFSQSGTYGLNNVTQASSSQGPLGTAYNIVPTAVSGGHQINHSITSTNNYSITYSVMAKPNGYNNIVLWSEGNAVNATFDLAGGTVLSTTGTTYTKIKNLGNGWSHCFMSYNAITTGSVGMRMYVDSSLTYTGNGTSGVLIAGMQVVVNTSGSTPYYLVNSYIPTTSTTASRANESLVFRAGFKTV